METRRWKWGCVAVVIILLGVMRVATSAGPQSSSSQPPKTIVPESRLATILPSPPLPALISPTRPETPSPETRQVKIWLDDFKPQPIQGESVYFFNRLDGDRGALNDSKLAWGTGQVTTTIVSGRSWGGVWMSLNHPIREGLPVNFSALLPSPIVPAYQSRMTGMRVVIARGTPNRAFRVELKDGSNLRWQNEIMLNGGREVVNVDLPALGNINQLVWVLDRASAGDYVVLESVSFTATSPIADTATVAFVWSYGMLLDNWNPATGLVRDRAKDASGEFDAIQSTGSLAAATAIAAQLGVLPRADAIRMVDRIGRTLRVDLPRLHGLWPHWVKNAAGKLTMVQDTEWSSVDTVIAAIGLLEAESGLGMDTSGTEQMLNAIEWNNLVTPGGISHGYTYAGTLIPYAWDTFGGESWLVELAYAGTTGRLAPMAYASAPTANGSGFIDELAWLFVAPPFKPDHWGTDWPPYRTLALDKQKGYYPSLFPASCFSQLGLFGLSAGEVPSPSTVTPQNIYQAFGVGGRFTAANDGSALLGAPVIVPHYAALAASLRPLQAITMWDWLIRNGYFTPLTNVESLLFPANSSCDPASVSWNDLKGSWNLALQTLGWGRYLAERRGLVPILWQATTANSYLRTGYLLLAPAESPATPTPGPASPPVPSPSSIPIPVPASAATPVPSSIPEAWVTSRSCEDPDESTVGQTLARPDALERKVHGQFGTAVSSTWPAKPGYVSYAHLFIPALDHLYLRLRYSKYSPSTVPILIYLDNEPTPRATLYPLDQGDWDRFIWTESIFLGNVAVGIHSIKFSTEGQQYGVVDLDEFILTGESPLVASPEVVETDRINKTIIWSTPTVTAPKK